MAAFSSCIGLRRVGKSASLRVIAIHSAGADASMYNRLFSEIDGKEALDLISVQLPGRAHRINESLGSNFFWVVESIYDELLTVAKDGMPMAFLGYSMGAAIAFELALKFQISNLPVYKLILCARYAPSYESMVFDRGALSDEELSDIISDLGGTPEEILHNRTLMDYYIKIIRADFSLIYNYRRGPEFKINSPIYSLAGIYDKEAPLQGVEKWSEFTTQKFELVLFESGHFFINSDHKLFLNCINGIIQDNVRIKQ